MTNTQINAVLTRMQSVLNSVQLKLLKEAMILESAIDIFDKSSCDNTTLLEHFLKAKKVEGCSKNTLTYYKNTLQKMDCSISKPFTQIETDDLRDYLDNYEQDHHSSKVTIDNIRRIMSSFFSWLEDEDYIVKSPARRIHRVKTFLKVKETFTDEELEIMRDKCGNKRDLAIIDLLASTGMRIGELVKLDRNDIDFAERECIVIGKGNKQRKAYFDARAKLHLLDYLRSRNDNNPALFVTLPSPHKRLNKGGIELRLRRLGRMLNISRTHPHKFRRTLATNAIDKGMPIEQVQKLLGHAKIDTTMHYALVNQSNVKASHRRYLE